MVTLSMRRTKSVVFAYVSVVENNQRILRVLCRDNCDAHAEGLHAVECQCQQAQLPNIDAKGGVAKD